MANAVASQLTTSVDLERVEALFHAHVDAVYNVAFRVVWNASDAEDVVQWTFVKALTRGAQLRDQSRQRPWLLQIAYREALMVLRRRRETPVDPDTMPETSSLPGPECAVLAMELASVIDAALSSLKANERAAIVLRDIEGLAMGDVADVLGIGLSAAKMRVHRGRASLRHELREVADEM